MARLRLASWSDGPAASALARLGGARGCALGVGRGTCHAACRTRGAASWPRITQRFRLCGAHGGLAGDCCAPLRSRVVACRRGVLASKAPAARAEAASAQVPCVYAEQSDTAAASPFCSYVSLHVSCIAMPTRRSVCGNEVVCFRLLSGVLKGGRFLLPPGDCLHAAPLLPLLVPPRVTLLHTHNWPSTEWQPVVSA